MKRLYTFIAAALAIATASAAQPLVKAERISVNSISKQEVVKRDLTKSTEVRVAPMAKETLNKGVSRHRKAPGAFSAADISGSYIFEAIGWFWSDSIGKDSLGHAVPGFESQPAQETLVVSDIVGTSDNKVTFYGVFNSDITMTGTFDPTDSTITIPYEETLGYFPVTDYDDKTQKYVETGDSIQLLSVTSDGKGITDIVFKVDTENRMINYTAPIDEKGENFTAFAYLFYKEKGTSEDDSFPLVRIAIAEGNEINSLMYWDIPYGTQLIERVSYIWVETNTANTEVTVYNMFGFLFNGQIFDCPVKFEVDYQKGLGIVNEGAIANAHINGKEFFIWSVDTKTNKLHDIEDIQFDLLSGTLTNGNKISGFGIDQLGIAQLSDIKNALIVKNVEIRCPFYLDENAGIEGVTVADENAPVEYFNLQGVRVANPEKGLYIKRQGKTVTKVLVK